MGIGNMLLCHMKWILAWEERWFSAFVFADLKSESTEKANEKVEYWLFWCKSWFKGSIYV